jgi:hypothetical protein
MKLDWLVFCVSTMAVVNGCRMGVVNNYPICDSEASAVRAHAAADFNCSMSDITVRPADADKQRWVANGCGKAVTYYCPQGDPLGSCRPEGMIAAQPIDLGGDRSVAAIAQKNDDADATFRASLKLVLASIPYKDCGPGGEGKVQLTFDEEGTATAVEIVSGNYEASTRACLVDRFRGVRAPASTSGKHVIVWGIHLQANAPTKGSWDS